MKYLFCFLLALLPMFLSSCKIDGEEEITVREDGSAHLTMRYEVPGMIFSDKAANDLVATLDKELGNQEDVRLITNRVDLEKGQRVIHIEFEVDAGADLDGLLDEPDASSDTGGGGEQKSDKMLRAIVGELSAQIEGLSVGVTRKVNLEPLLDEYIGKQGASMLGDFEFRYTVHLPMAVEQSNAHQVLDGGKTLKWRYFLREMKQEPIVMAGTVPIPLPWWVYALVGLALCLVLSLIFWGCKKFRQKSVA